MRNSVFDLRTHFFCISILYFLYFCSIFVDVLVVQCTIQHFLCVQTFSLSLQVMLHLNCSGQILDTQHGIACHNCHIWYWSSPPITIQNSVISSFETLLDLGTGEKYILGALVLRQCFRYVWKETVTRPDLVEGWGWG